jgi:hypothetical protein
MAMAHDAVTALRLRLPCPNCDDLFTTVACALGEHVALSCTRCGHGWVETARPDAALAKRAALFCADAAALGRPQVVGPAAPDLALTFADAGPGPSH